ncbi:MAG: zinc-binding dehydrogenase [Candidatus Caldatribacterium sp.]|nr:zinc-binding dehydrogenase [Candidatus Caldatribacterium sp.]
MKMKKVFVIEKGRLEICEVDVPKVEEGSLLVKVEVATICNQTDLHILDGLHPGATPFPCVLGHEGAGVVVEVGEGIREFAVGDRVAIRSWFGGTFAEYVNVRPEDAVKIPDDMDFSEASLLEISSCVFALVDQCVSLGREVLILGQGTAGLIATQLSAASGAARTIVVSRSTKKLDMAIQFGANIVINSRLQDPVEEINRLTRNNGVETVLECTGVPSMLALCPLLVKQQGVIGIFGACVYPVSFDFLTLHFKRACLLTTGYKWAYSRETLEKVLSLWKTGRLKLRPLVTHWFSLERIRDAFSLLREGREDVIKIAIKP